MSEFEARVVASDLGFIEGPVIRRDSRLLVTSMERHQVYAVARDGTTRVLAETGGTPNGAAEGADGSVYIAQVGFDYVRDERDALRPAGRTAAMTGGVQVIRPDGTVEYVTRDPVHPNDLCFGPDGHLYVTDPTRTPAFADGRLWRVDVSTGEAELLASVPWYPNGIGFGADDSWLWVASSRDSRIYRFPFSATGLGPPELAIQMPDGHPDGFAFDVEGNLIVAVALIQPALQVWDPRGHLLETIEIDASELCTNVAVDADGTLFVCDSGRGSLLAVNRWHRPGLPLHPFRD